MAEQLSSTPGPGKNGWYSADSDNTADYTVTKRPFSEESAFVWSRWWDLKNMMAEMTSR
jgi:hypothetical protein